MKDAKPKKVFLDFDDTLVASTKVLCQLYHEEFKDHPDYIPVTESSFQSWGMRDALPLKQDPGSYFEEERFFEILEPIENPSIVLNLAEKIPVIIPTIGRQRNIQLKSKYIDRVYPGIHAIYLFSGNDCIMDKSIIDMYNCLFIDDNLKNIQSSNAAYKFIFGPEKEHNKTNLYSRVFSLEDLFKKFNL